MNIIGCDLHTRYQVIAILETETGEMVSRRLEHENGEARTFYKSLAPGARVGIEATFPAHWFERLLAECGHELWVGDAARIRASEVRRQKTDGRDAELLLDLLLKDSFPRIWAPSVEERDLRQLLIHRNKMVRTRTAVKNQLHAMAISQGVCRKRKLWSDRGRAELSGLTLLLGEPAAERAAALAGSVGRHRQGTGPGGGGGGGGTSRGQAAADASRSGSGDGPGVCAHAGAGGTLRQQSQAGELPGAESAGAFQRGSPAPGSDHQARQQHAALAAGGSGTHGRPR